MKALRIQNVYFTVPDIEKAKSFYQGLLAPSLKFEDQNKWVQFDLEGSNLALASHEEGGAFKNAIVVFEIENAAGLEQTISALGGTLISTRDMGSHGTVYTAKDLDGNVFQLYTRAGAEAQ